MARHSSRKGKPEKKLKSTLSTPAKSAKSAAAKLSVPKPAVRSVASHEGVDALPRSAKLVELDRQLKVTRTATGSLGKYDNKLSGETTKEKGLRRQFESNQVDARTEREKALSILNSLDDESKIKDRKLGKDADATTINVRKAIRTASKGQGSASLAAGNDKRGAKAKGKSSFAAKSKSRPAPPRSSGKGKRK